MRLTSAEQIMRVLIAGSSGLIGSALVRRLTAEGSTVVRLIRPHTAANLSRDRRQEAVLWDPADGILDLTAAAPFDAVVNLAGENLVSGLWTSAKKRRILESRRDTTSLLGRAVMSLAYPPTVFFNASAVGYYGDCGDKVLTEATPPGKGFLAHVCSEWEGAALSSIDSHKTRLVIGRLGIVLSPDGGALAKMLPIFRLGFGGKMGSGRQYLSWITIDDAVSAIVHVLTHDIRGPLNVVAPNPVTNGEFVNSLAAAIQRPKFLSVPAFALRTILGEMADETLLTSIRAIPERLASSNFVWQSHELKPALERLSK